MRSFLFCVVIIWTLAICAVCRGQFDDRPQTQLVSVSTQTQMYRATPHNRPDPADPAVVFITTPSGHGGSGIALEITEKDTQSVVLTNDHVIRDDRTGQTWTHAFVSGKHEGQPVNIRLSVIWSDPDTDFAVLHSKFSKTQACYPIAPAVPPVGTLMTMVGWGGAKQTTRQGARIDVGHANLSMDVEVRSGDSGGAMLHNGAIVGVMAGYPHVRKSKPPDRPGGGHPGSSQVSLSTLQTVIPALGRRHGFTPLIKEYTTTQWQQCDPVTGVWQSSPGRQLPPSNPGTIGPARIPPHSHSMPEHEHEAKPHTHPLQDHEHVEVPEHSHDEIDTEALENNIVQKLKADPAFRGAQGVGVKSLKMDGNGHVTATYTDGRIEDVGQLEITYSITPR